MQKLQLVRVRGRRWRIVDVVPHDRCTLLTLTAADRSSATNTRHVLAPFDDVDSIAKAPRGRGMRLRRWRRACRALLASAVPPGCLRSATSARLDLLPHQLEPVLAVLRGLGSRLLLADDVGLGKTVQAGLILSELLARRCVERAVVLTPAGVRDQWTDELWDRFGIPATRGDARTLRHLASTLPLGVNPWSTRPVVVASMDYVKRPDVLPAAAACRWDALILDEAHLVSVDSERRRAVEQLAARAAFVILVSATPHSGDEAAFKDLCSMGSTSSRDDPLLVFRRTRQSVRPYAVRRVRRLHVLPSTAEVRMFAALARYRRAVREEHGSRALALSVLDKRAYSSPWSLAESVERRLLAVSAVCEQPLEQLLLPIDDGNGELSTEDAAPAWPADVALADPVRERRLLSAVSTAAHDAAERLESKIAALARFLRRAREPALVFTEFRDTALHVQRMLGRGEVIHGGLGRSDRARLLSAFTTGSCDLLIATDAAAQGLNLQRSCRLVLNLELPWNPMRLEQRIGRVDRIGQTRRVHAIHFVGRGTGEARILDQLQGRIARAREDIGAPDPIGFDGAANASESASERTDHPDVSRLALAEAARVSACRSIQMADDTLALGALEAAPWWIARARRRSRAAMAGRALFVYRIIVENEQGTVASSRVLALTVDSSEAGAAVDSTVVADSMEQFLRDVAPIERAFSQRRLSRERAIVRACECHPQMFQPALFDRRAERAYAELSASDRELQESLVARLAIAERQERLQAPSAQLLLVLLP